MLQEPVVDQRKLKRCIWGGANSNGLALLRTRRDAPIDVEIFKCSIHRRRSMRLHIPLRAWLFILVLLWLPSSSSSFTIRSFAPAGLSLHFSSYVSPNYCSIPTRIWTLPSKSDVPFSDATNATAPPVEMDREDFLLPLSDRIQSQPFDHVQNTDGTYTVRFLSEDGLQIQEEKSSAGYKSNIAAPVTVENTSDTDPKPQALHNNKLGPGAVTEPSSFTSVLPSTGFNVVLTHCTADFDSLASAVGLAKLWSNNVLMEDPANRTIHVPSGNRSFDSASHVPTYVVLPRGAHPGVQRFLGLHKHLFPIRSLKSILSSEHVGALNRLALVDAQRRDRLGPAEPLLQYANRITVVDHHVDQDSDISAHDYVMDHVGSVSTMIVERLQQAVIATNGKLLLTDAEATLLALGIHADTGNLCFDSSTVRDAYALAWCMSQGASQTAIAEHGQSSLSIEQQGVLTQALVNANTTVAHGVTVSTVLLQADGFINGLAAVTQDALELSSSDIFLLGLVYKAKSGSGSRKSKKGTLLTTQLLKKDSRANVSPSVIAPSYDEAAMILYAEAWQGGEDALRRRRLRAAFDRTDMDGSGYLEEGEIAASLASSGVMALPDTATLDLIKEIDTDGNGKIDFEEFVVFAAEAEKRQKERNSLMGRKGTTMIIIGRVKAGVNMKSVKLNKLLEQFGGGGHAKAASATVRLNDDTEAEGILQALVDELIATNLQEQPTAGDFVRQTHIAVFVLFPPLPLNALCFLWLSFFVKDDFSRSFCPSGHDRPTSR
jgi:nanoRNase/pAp phosphatase (c-di-AMP/oligoRNAs hydrolase)